MMKLRALTKTDAKTTWEWRNRDAIKYFFSGHPFPVNLEKEEKWVESVLLNNIPHSYFAVEVDEKLCGLVSLRNIDLLHRSGEFAIFIAEGRGLGNEATAKLLEFGFEDMGLNRIWLKVMCENQMAINLYKKCGFQKEGTQRSSVFKKGAFHDEDIMSILKSDYDALK